MNTVSVENANTKLSKPKSHIVHVMFWALLL